MTGDFATAALAGTFSVAGAFAAAFTGAFGAAGAFAGSGAGLATGLEFAGGLAVFLIGSAGGFGAGAGDDGWDWGAPPACFIN